MAVWASKRTNAWSACFLLGLLALLACLNTDARHNDSYPIAFIDKEKGRPRGSSPEGLPNVGGYLIMSS